MKLKRKPCVNVRALVSLAAAACLVALLADELVPRACCRWEELNDIDAGIEATAGTLGYSSDSCRDLIALARAWDLQVWKSRILKAQGHSCPKAIQMAQVAAIEDEAAHELYDRIRKAVKSTNDFQYFDVARIVKDRKATCLGYSELFYILANSVGVSGQVIGVQRSASGRRVSHAACLVHLSDGTEIMADLTPGGFITRRFRFLDAFVKTKGSWELKQENNPMRLHRRITLLDKNQLASVVYCQRADWNWGSGEFAEGFCDINKAIVLDPKNELALCFRATFNNLLRRPRDAISDSSRAIEIDPRSAMAYDIRGSAYSRSRDDKHAIADFSRAIEIDSHDASAYVGRGYSMAQLGRREEAREDFQKAMQLDASLTQLVKEYSELLEEKSERAGRWRLPETERHQ